MKIKLGKIEIDKDKEDIDNKDGIGKVKMYRKNCMGRIMFKWKRKRFKGEKIVCVERRIDGMIIEYIMKEIILNDYKNRFKRLLIWREVKRLSRWKEVKRIYLK